MAVEVSLRSKILYKIQLYLIKGHTYGYGLYLSTKYSIILL